MSITTIRLALSQINPTVGDIQGNSKKILDSITKAKKGGADIVVLPELIITGYPPEDLLLKPKFVDDNIAALKKIAPKVTNLTALIGFVDKKGKNIYNSLALIHNGKIRATYHKILLPNYGVFDEQRYFTKGSDIINFKLKGVTFGLGICEDIWSKEGPLKTQAACGARAIININASPYNLGKHTERDNLIKKRSKDNHVKIVYLNAVGGQDELVFDGQSFVTDEKGKVLCRQKAFEEDFTLVDLNFNEIKASKKKTLKNLKTISLASTNKGQKPLEAHPPLNKNMPQIDEVYGALKLGLKDYVAKNGFTHCIIALSGGIDSALVTTIAAETLGSEFITTVFLPSKFTSQSSIDDAHQMAENLKVEHITIPIDSTFDHYNDILKSQFKNMPFGVAEENLQARIRGNIVMALSNKFNYLVLTTGNKSEMSVGYATLYGDMAGGFALIKDLSKTLVYELSRFINEVKGREIIPESTITKEPSAELRDDQLDSDSLPPYEDLDPILKAYVEDDLTLKEIVKMGYKKEVAERVIRLVDQSEYKRRQAPPGVRITPRGLGKDRRMPITNKFTDH